MKCRVIEIYSGDTPRDSKRPWREFQLKLKSHTEVCKEKHTTNQNLYGKKLIRIYRFIKLRKELLPILPLPEKKTNITGDRRTEQQVHVNKSSKASPKNINTHQSDSPPVFWWICEDFTFGKLLVSFLNSSY